MQLSNDPDGKALLQRVILDYYQQSDRTARYFLESQNTEWEWFYLYFLVDRTHVFRYGIGADRNLWVGGIELAIGPHYFGPADFWSFEDSRRFHMSADTESVIHNLRMLDEFWKIQGDKGPE